MPLLVKIAPDLADDDIDAIADLALELGLDGIIATNTTIAAPGLASDPAPRRARSGAGGLSGAPLRPRALAVLRRLRARVGDRLVLIAVGGIETADDAWERIRAGATLVQAYTGFIYGGPRGRAASRTAWRRCAGRGAVAARDRVASRRACRRHGGAGGGAAGGGAGGAGERRRIVSWRWRGPGPPCRAGRPARA